jgi:hypothetical protein
VVIGALNKGARAAGSGVAQRTGMALVQGQGLRKAVEHGLDAKEIAKDAVTAYVLSGADSALKRVARPAPMAGGTGSAGSTAPGGERDLRYLTSIGKTGKRQLKSRRARERSRT